MTTRKGARNRVEVVSDDVLSVGYRYQCARLELEYAYQVGAGVGYAVSEKVVIDLTYRYFGTGDVKYRNLELENSSHNIYLGLRYDF